MNRVLSVLATVGILFCISTSQAQTSMSLQGGVSMTVQSGTNVNVQGNIEILNNSGIDNSGNVILSGDWTNNSGSDGLINSSPGMVTLNGDTQEIGGADQTLFYDLRIGGNSFKWLSINTEVEHELDLGNQEFYTDTFNLLISSTIDTAITRSSGFVSSTGNGRLTRRMALNSEYLFPVGSRSIGYRPVSLTPSNNFSNTFSARLVANDPSNDGFDRAQKDTSLCSINDAYYHIIERDNGISAMDIKIGFDSIQDGNFGKIGAWINQPQWQNTISGNAIVSYLGNLKLLEIPTWTDFSNGAFALGDEAYIPQIVSSGPLTFCQPASIQLTTTQPFPNLQWSNGSTNDTISVSASADISVIGSDPSGCTGTSDTISILALAQPTAGYAQSVLGFDASFANQSIDALSYYWDFGDGDTSSAANPTHTYAANGTYAVCLISSNVCGNDTTCKSVVINCPAPQAAYGISRNNLEVTFNNNSSAGQNTYYWVFGDGDTSSASNPVHTYDSVGTYQTCLVTTNLCGSDTVCRLVTVTCLLPNGNFTSSVNGLSVSFTNISTNGGSYTWLFGDGDSALAANTSHTYSTPGTYQVCMIAANSCGNDTVCQNVTVTCTLPNSAFNYSKSNQTVTFTDQSTNGVTSWFWDFGDGNSSTLTNPSYVYSNPGTYQACLITTNSCGNDTSCQTITVTCPLPIPNFSYSSSSLQVNFNDLSSSGTTSWYWDFGDGNSSTSQNPGYTYNLPGTYQVCLISGNSCGEDTVCQTVTVTCQEPIAGFSDSISDLRVDFKDLSNFSPTGWIWDFGDGTSSNNPNPSHSYSNYGIYTVCLIVDNNCGTDTICKTINIEPVGLDEIEFGVNYSVFPNPVKSNVYIQIKSEQSSILSVTLINAVGQEIRSEVNSGYVLEQNLEWDMSQLSSGFYFVKAEFENGILTRKIQLVE